MDGWKDICLLIFIFSSRGSLIEKMKTNYNKYISKTSIISFKMFILLVEIEIGSSFNVSCLNYFCANLQADSRIGTSV